MTLQLTDYERGYLTAYMTQLCLMLWQTVVTRIGSVIR